jgi:electron transport complex protein RnfD
MYPTQLHSYLLWRSSVDPDQQSLASRRFTATVSLIPAVMVGMFVFGWWAGLVLLTSIVTALITDIVCHKYIWKDSVGTRDGIWLLTGLILALFMPPNVGLWVPVLGSLVAIVIGKYWSSIDSMPFFQPALIGLLALYIAGFAGQSLTHSNFMLATNNGEAQWPELTRRIARQPASSADGGKEMAEVVGQLLRDFFGGDIRNAEGLKEYRESQYSDTPLKAAVYGPRPIDAVKANPGRDVSIPAGAATKSYDAVQMILGYVPGTIGGASALALFLGILFLLFTGAVHWALPTFALGTLFGGFHLFAWLFSGGSSPVIISENIPIHLLTGSTLLAIFYLAADPTCAPRSFWGKVYAGIAFGIVELFLRLFTPMAEGVLISVVIVQGLSFVIDQYLAPPVEQNTTPSSVGLTSSTLGRL